MLRRSLPLSRMASTVGGMRRILKNKGSTIDYIRQAVETGVYRTQDELEKVWKERRDSTEDLHVIMRRFRQDIVRGTSIHDYPDEYLILQQHPPIPDPPRTPVKFREPPEPNPVEHLVRQYYQKFQHQHRRKNRSLAVDSSSSSSSGDDSNMSSSSASASSPEDYYRRLLGIPAPDMNTAMGQKSAGLQKAYAAAVKHYQLERTSDLTEDEVMAQVEALLQESHAQEMAVASERTAAVVQEAMREKAMATSHTANQQDWFAASDEETASGLLLADRKEADAEQQQPNKENDAAAAATSTTTKSAIRSIFQDNPRALEGMMRWSERLMAVPYEEWTIGASTALDHWIARQVLGVSEETWLSLLEGDDPALLSTGRNIIAVREALFPETRLEPQQEQQQYGIGDEEHELYREREDEQDVSAAAAAAAAAVDARTQDKKQDKSQDDGKRSIEELLATLGALDSKDDDGGEKDKYSSTLQSSWEWMSDLAGALGEDDLDTQIDKLVQQLQKWRQKNQQEAFDNWSAHDKDNFNSWLKEYVNVVLASDVERGTVDYDATRRALLSQPPISSEQADEFWSQLQDESHAMALLDAMRRDGPPAGATILQSSFWDLSQEDQLDRLLNLGALRPLLDEYTKETDRLRFLQRHGDSIMAGVPLEHLVEDPDGPIKASDLEGILVDGRRPFIPKNARFRLEMRPYQSAGDEAGGGGTMSADEKTRALYKAWNQQKSGRANYEERLFCTGRLGMRYSDRILRDDELSDDDDDED